MKLRIPHSLAVVAAALLWVNSGIASSNERVGSNEGASGRLYYYFSLAEDEQRQRAVDLQRLVQPFGADLEVMGIVREESIRGSQLNLSYLLMTREDARISMPAELEVLFAHEKDHAILVDAFGHLVAEGPGSELSSVLAYAGNGSIITEIDESTWGKIKELFQ